jgi:hypothetical protein
MEKGDGPTIVKTTQGEKTENTDWLAVVGRLAGTGLVSFILGCIYGLAVGAVLWLVLLWLSDENDGVGDDLDYI